MSTITSGAKEREREKKHGDEDMKRDNLHINTHANSQLVHNFAITVVTGSTPAGKSNTLKCAV
jgi:hypothetical protein